MSADRPDDPAQNGTSRRAFLAGAGLAGLTAAAALATRATAQESEPAPQEEEATTQASGGDQRSFSSSRATGPLDPRLTGGLFFMTLEGATVGFLPGLEGGYATGEVVSEKLGFDGIQRKHVANVKYEDFTVRLGVAFTEGPLYDWILTSLQARAPRKNGEIIACDFNLNARASAKFSNALITETAFPACDAASKDPGYLTAKIAPEFVTHAPSSGQLKAQVGQKQKSWLPSNFRLQIDGLDCTKVSKIDAFTIKQKVMESPVGEERDFEKQPTSEFPNLVIELSLATAQTWAQWYEDFLINGNNGSDNEKTGSLEFLSANRQDVLLKLNFSGLGIFELTAEKPASNQSIPRLKAELYCEKMELSPGKID